MMCTEKKDKFISQKPEEDIDCGTKRKHTLSDGSDPRPNRKRPRPRAVDMVRSAGSRIRADRDSDSERTPPTSVAWLGSPKLASSTSRCCIGFSQVRIREILGNE